MEEEDL